MKPLRLVLFGLLGLALLLVVVIALAFAPGVQTWAARTFAPAGPDLTVDIGRVNAGLHHTRVENVRVVQPGLVLTLPSADIEVGVLDAAGGKIEVRKLVAKNWILDVSAPATTSAADGSGATKSTEGKSPADAAKDAFDGLFKQLELPFDLLIDGVDLSGEVLLPEGTAQVVLTGGGLAAGKTGEFSLKVEFKGADATALTLNGVASAGMGTPRTFEHASFVAKASATGPQVPKGAALDLTATAKRAGAAEDYVVAVRAAQRELLSATITLPAGSAPLSGAWKLDVTRADAVPFAMGQPLPEFVAKGQGTFEADRAFAKIKAVGTLDASVESLGVVQKEFAALGRLALAATFDVATEGDLVRASQFTARVTGAKPVASVTALQSIEFNTATGELKAANPAAELLRVVLDGVPLAWAAPFLGDIALAGDDVRGVFVASARDNGFALRPSAPVTITNLSVSQAGETLLHAIDVSLAAQADYTPKGWTADVTDLSVIGAGASLLKLTANAAQASGADQPLTASGKFESSLPALLAQPVAGGAAALKQGVARGDFSVTSADTQQANVTLQLADMVAVDASELPEVALQARATVDASGRINAKVPVVITRAKRKTDLLVDAAITTADTATNINAKLSSDVVHMSDLMLFSALSPTPPDAAQGGPSPAPAPQSGEKPAPAPAPTEPLWAGVTGEVKLVFARIIYSKGVETSLNGTVKISPDALTLQGLKGVFKTGGQLKADGGLKFEASRKQPYALKADVVMTDVEPAPLLRALSPKEEPPVDGKFDLTTTLAGRAVDPSLFNEDVIGDIRLSSKGGTFKALNVKSNAIVDGAGTVAGIAGAIGILAGSNTTVKYAERARAAVDVTKQLGAIKFDQLNMVVVRDKKKNLDIKDITLVSPLVHLTGSGQIKNAKGKSLVERPLLMTLKMGAKDKLAADLRTLKLIEGQPDPLGYASLVEDLKLDGSLESIGTSQLKGLLDRALSN